MLKTLVLVYALVVTASGISITGTVKDDETKKQLTNVQVIINETDTLYTNSDGTFNFVLGEEELKSIELNLDSFETKKYVYIDDETTLKGKRKRDK